MIVLGPVGQHLRPPAWLEGTISRYKWALGNRRAISARTARRSRRRGRGCQSHRGRSSNPFTRAGTSESRGLTSGNPVVPGRRWRAVRSVNGTESVACERRRAMRRRRVRARRWLRPATWTVSPPRTRPRAAGRSRRRFVRPSAARCRSCSPNSSRCSRGNRRPPRRRPGSRVAWSCSMSYSYPDSRRSAPRPESSSAADRPVPPTRHHDGQVGALAALSETRRGHGLADPAGIFTGVDCGTGTEYLASRGRAASGTSHESDHVVRRASCVDPGSASAESPPLMAAASATCVSASRKTTSVRGTKQPRRIWGARFPASKTSPTMCRSSWLAYGRRFTRSRRFLR